MNRLLLVLLALAPVACTGQGQVPYSRAEFIKKLDETKLAGRVDPKQKIVLAAYSKERFIEVFGNPHRDFDVGLRRTRGWEYRCSDGPIFLTVGIPDEDGRFPLLGVDMERHPRR